MPNPLSCLTATVFLPPNFFMHIYDCELVVLSPVEELTLPTDDANVIVAPSQPRLIGSIVFYTTKPQSEIEKVYEDVPIRFFGASGQVLFGKFNMSRLRCKMRIGVPSVFIADIESVGPYEITLAAGKDELSYERVRKGVQT